MAPAFSIANIPIYGHVVLAPMDGISDQPFRWLCRRMGSAFTVSEFINVLDVPRKLNDLDKRTCFSETERPFGFQLYGNDEEHILNAAKLLIKNEPDFFDLNLGCSVRRIAGRGAGAGLLKDPNKIKVIISSLVKETKIPITIKLRLGWDNESMNYFEIARIAEGEGISMIAIHGRTKTQNWSDPADWEAIRKLKSQVHIPVIGNGDIQSVDDVQKMLTNTGCEGVMVGRAAVGNPWLFSGIEKEELSIEQLKKVIYLHWSLMQSFYGREKARILFKKHLKAYLNCSQFSNMDRKGIIRSDNPFRYLI